MQNNNNHTGLTLNVLEVIPSKDEVTVFIAPFKEHTLKEYRNKYSEYYFHRDGNNIYSWELSNEPKTILPTEFKIGKITRKDNTLVFNKVIESGIVQWFRNNNSSIRLIKYSSVWEVEYKKDIKDFKGLSVVPVLNFSLHPFYSVQTDKLVLALSLRYSSKQVFTATEKEFKELSFDTRNLKRLYDGSLIANTNAVSKFLSATGQTKEFNDYRNKLNTESNLFKQLTSIIELFNKHIREKIYLPDGLEVSALNFHNLPCSNFINDVINKPGYFFYQERPGSQKFYNVLTQELKPFTFDVFNNRIIKILVITPDTHQGTTEIFIKQLESKLINVLHLSKLEFTYLSFDSKLETYETAISDFDCRGYEIAIVTVSSYDKSIQINKSPYYITKAKLLNERIPTQEVTVEVMRRADNMIYEAIALNIYSKMGGMTWAIDRVEKGKLEIVIGISSTVNFENKRIIGFANVFDFNGKYLIGDCSTLSTFDDYTTNLETYLTQSIKALIQSKSIQKGDEFRIIFHLSKAASKKYELKAIERALAKFKDYKIQFGIVHLSYNHNLRLFQDGGNGVPNRGTFVQLSTFQGIIHLGSRTKVPIFVRLDQRSTYRDLFDACKQVIYFCHLCYRSFRPANVPVTIKYPSLMAKLADELSRVPRWDTSQMNKIKDKLWFI